MVNLDDAIIARLESHGFKFEVFVDPDLAADFRNPDYDNKDIDISDILAVEEIFKDAKKGDKAPEEGLEKVLGTTDVLEAATTIIKKGHIHLTAQQKRVMQEDKHKKIINTIAREAINPQTGLPHPVKRIENAMSEAKVRIDPFKSVDEQVQTSLKAIRTKIPIRFEKIKVAVMIPGDAVGKAYTSIAKLGKIKKEEWQQDGSWVAIVEISGGLQDTFNSSMQEISGGNAEVKVIK